MTSSKGKGDKTYNLREKAEVTANKELFKIQ